MKKGIIYGFTAYFCWGLFPIYFKVLEKVPALQVVGHRIAWSFVFLVFLVLVRKDWPKLSQLLRRPGLWLIFLIAALLIAANWLLYVYAVQAGFIVEGSLGYYITPLFNILLGVAIFHERLRNAQWAAIGLAALGVIYLAFDYGRLPWIALAIAFTFGCYGLVKKKSPIGPFYSLTMETAVLFVPTVVYLLAAQHSGTGAFGHTGPLTTTLLVLAGPITIFPLLLFGSAARQIDLSLMGFLQYISPTMQFLIGVLIYREPFTFSSLIGFCIIWTALIALWVEGIIQSRKTRLVAVQV
jgi:chloramphenicol-sensitive protein RarD